VEHLIAVGSGRKTLKRKEQLLLNMGGNRVLVLLLPVFTEFENDAVLTDAITTGKSKACNEKSWMEFHSV